MTEPSGRVTLWGIDLRRAITEAAVAPGDQVRFSCTGQAAVTLPDGRQYMTYDFGPDGGLDNLDQTFVVPEGHYFFMGDNRDNSQDSRYDQSVGVGYVPAENLIGKAEIILFSWSPGASLFNPISWFSKVRFSRFFTDLD